MVGRINVKRHSMNVFFCSRQTNSVSGFKNVSTFIPVNFSQSFLLSSNISNCSKQYNLTKDSFATLIAESFSPFKVVQPLMKAHLNILHVPFAL